MLRGLRYTSLAAGALCAAVLAGCGSVDSTRTASSTSIRTELGQYVARIEPIRVTVNRLLDRADPILQAFRERHIPAAQAARRIASLERQFATFTVDIAAIQPSNSALRSLHSEYAETYILEDAYLSALVSGLAQQDVSDLPNTQSAQRAAIIRWRTGLTVLAQNARLALPADLQQAGRGEIAPSPEGS